MGQLRRLARARLAADDDAVAVRRARRVARDGDEAVARARRRQLRALVAHRRVRRRRLALEPPRLQVVAARLVARDLERRRPLQDLVLRQRRGLPVVGRRRLVLSLVVVGRQEVLPGLGGRCVLLLLLLLFGRLLGDDGLVEGAGAFLQLAFLGRVRRRVVGGGREQQHALDDGVDDLIGAALLRFRRQRRLGLALRAQRVELRRPPVAERRREHSIERQGRRQRVERLARRQVVRGFRRASGTRLGLGPRPQNRICRVRGADDGGRGARRRRLALGRARALLLDALLR
mmetsp:Transcript_23388/g.70185  ORF Transcript_23388/g.70185 Transcript_23388/m.70185 type:complete len:289 (-) Transcript_23388:173-1039(-)